MMIQEFTERTGFYPDDALYEIIEEHYIAFGGSKDDFCKAYKENVDGLAEQIQYEANMARHGIKIEVEPVVQEPSEPTDTAVTVEEMPGYFAILKSVDLGTNINPLIRAYENIWNHLKADEPMRDITETEANIGMSYRYWLGDLGQGFVCNYFCDLHSIYILSGFERYGGLSKAELAAEFGNYMHEKLDSYYEYAFPIWEKKQKSKKKRKARAAA